MERDLIGERTADVLGMKKVKGEWVGRVPIGFKMRRKGKELQVDEEQMKVVEKIKRLRRRGLSIREISGRVGISKSTVAR
jgi:DNA invertase Pin-like site-specific DNA recombinase